MSDVYTHETDADELEFDPSKMTWIVQDGTAHIYCADSIEASAVAEHVDSLDGTAIEQDGEFLYCKFQLSFEDSMQMAEECNHAITEDKMISLLDSRRDDIAAELRSHGFNVRIEP